MFRQRVRVPVGLVDLATRDGWLRSLAVYVILKSRYSNSTFYSPSLRKLGSLCGIGKDAMSYHLSVLRSKGLAIETGANLTLVGFSKMVELSRAYKDVEFKWYKAIYIIAKQNVQEQFRILQGRAVLKSINQQRRNIDVKLEDLKILRMVASEKSYRLTDAQYNRWKKLRTEVTPEKVDETIKLSAKGIGELLNISQRSATILKSYLVKEGIISSTKILGNIVHQRVSKQAYNRMLEFNAYDVPTFWYKGNVYQTNQCILEYGSNVTTKCISYKPLCRKKESKI